MSDAVTGGVRDEPFEAPVVSSTLVHEGRVWDVRSDTVRNGDAAGRMLLIQQYRHPIRHRDWEVPAGLLDVAGEPPMATAQRELAEEADLVAAAWQPLVSIFTTPGGNDEVVHLFLARGWSPAPEVHEREDEEADIRLEWVSVDEVISGVLGGSLRNGILSVGVLAAAEVLRRERQG